jgi:hypothetical protein
MKYTQIKTEEFYRRINTEERARNWVWKSRFGGKDFVCPGCQSEEYWQHQKKAEMRECAACHRQVRLRAGTIFQDSKIPILTWVRAIYFVMASKRGISALELKRQLEMKSYGTTWSILHKIREALRQRDEAYKLQQIIELDGATFGRENTGNAKEVLIAVETKTWIDDKGRTKEKAGFAKVFIAKETKENAQKFLNEAIKPGSQINTDGSPSLRNLTGADVDYQVTGNDPEIIARWLPWVHKFISNAKTWVLGTHHGVESKYLESYLSEYTYRFNRRHDPDSLFHRALTACALAQPRTSQALFR